MMTIEIQLSQGKTAIIDDCDADLAELKWYANRLRKSENYYAIRGDYSLGRMSRKTIQLHRVILARILGRELSPKDITDHINHNPLDNRRCNLRLVNTTQNRLNCAKVWGKSKYRGVWPKQGKYHAMIRSGVMRLHLGSFDNEVDAAKAYDEAAKKYHGEFAYLNFPDADTGGEG